MYYLVVPLPGGEQFELALRATLGELLVASLLLFWIVWHVAAWAYDLLRGVFG